MRRADAVRGVLAVAVAAALLAALLAALSESGDDARDENLPASAPVALPADAAPLAESDVSPPPRRRAAAAEVAAEVEEEEAVGGLTRVRVTARGGGAIAGARVLCEDADGGVTERLTGDDGVATLDPPLRASFVRVTVSAPGRVPRKRVIHEAAIASGEEALVELDRGGACEGVVLDDETMQPIAGAAVFDVEGVVTRTGFDGRFLLDGVPLEGEIDVYVQEPRHVGAVVSVAPPRDGRRVPVEVRLRPAGVLRGRVTSASGAPVERALVRARTRREELLPETVGPVPLQHDATTSADGLYELGGLDLDAGWSVEWSAAGFVSAPRSTVRFAQRVREIVRDVALDPRGRLQIRVTRPDGPAPFARIVLRNAGDEEQVVTAGSDGTCSIESPYLGPCTLTVVASRAAPARVPVFVRSAATEKVDVALGQGFAVSGLVVDDAGSAIAGALVNVVTPIEINGRSARCDERGAFRIEGLPDGGCVLLPSARGHAPAESIRTTAPASDVRAVVPRMGTFSVTLRAPGRSGPPNASFLFERGMQTVPFGDSAVRFTCEPGEQRIGIRVDGFVPLEATVTVRPGRDESLGVIVLDPGVDLVGSVRDRQGRAIDAARVVVAGLLPFDAGATADEAGSFRLQHVPAGEVSVRVSALGYATATQTVTAGRGEAAALVLARAPRLRGTVRGAGALRSRELAVEFLPGGSRFGDHSVRCDAQGAFETVLQPGSWAIVVRRGETELARADLELVEEKDETIELVVDR